MKIIWIFACALSLGAVCASAQGAGHRVTADQVVVNSQQHWQNWSFGAGTLDVGAGGEVRPRRLRKNINAVENAREFLRLNPPNYIKKDAADIELSDGIRAGSNAPGVLALFDGDMETYWEPNALEPGVDLATQWWFIVDLGRFVMARKIVLKFVDEALGDPFLQFDVLVSEGRQPKGNSRSETPEFRRVARTLVPNKHQRLFEIELEYAEEFAGMGLRFVQVIATGSDFAKGREISRDEYEALPAADRGAILYHKRLPNGNEAAVKKEVYDRLEASRQGPVRYFVRERPRLAELEVWAEGDEILINTVERGGMVTSTQSLALASLFDGNVLSFSEVIFIFSPGQLKSPEGEVFFDMGASFWIDAFRMALGARQRNFEGYRLDFSNGEREADGSLKWTSAAAVSGAEVLGRSVIGTKSVMGNNFSPIRARFFRFVWNQIVRGVGNSGAAILADPSELQLYGEGFMSEVSLTSDLVRLGGSRNLVSLEWDADVPPGTSVLVQTRTGNELAENLRYFKKDGTEVSKDQYDKLLSIFKGDIIAEEVVGGDWSGWSQPGEDPSGSPITSPSPREFLEIRATLLSDAPSASATLRSIRLNFTHPVAQSLTGEVAPAVVETLGQEQRFSLFVRPNFDRRDPGFDELLLVAPADMRLGFDGLYVGAGEVLAGRDMDGLAIADVEVVATGGDSLRLAFPPIGPESGVEVLRLDFTTALFAAGAVLQASLQNSSSEEWDWQRVDPGDAVGAVESNTTTLRGAVQSRSLLEDVVIPEVFTPNGDGVNDQASFHFKVIKVGDDSPVEVLIYDLSGRLMRQLVEQRGVSTGAYGVVWDGRDASGAVVAPGVYVVRLRVDTDTQGARVGGGEVLHTIAVAY